MQTSNAANEKTCNDQPFFSTTRTTHMLYVKTRPEETSALALDSFLLYLVINTVPAVGAIVVNPTLGLAQRFVAAFDARMV